MEIFPLSPEFRLLDGTPDHSRDSSNFGEKMFMCICTLYIDGFRPEWCISTIYHAFDTPFWPGTLDMYIITESC